MNLKRPPHNPQSHHERQHAESRLAHLDTVMDGYVHWRDESRAAGEFYRRRQTAGSQERDDAFDRYIAALDREERAADGYRRAVERADAY